MDLQQQHRRVSLLPDDYPCTMTAVALLGESGGGKAQELAGFSGWTWISARDRGARARPSVVVALAVGDVLDGVPGGAAGVDQQPGEPAVVTRTRSVHSRDGSFAVLGANLRCTMIMAAGSTVGAVLGGPLLGVFPDLQAVCGPSGGSRQPPKFGLPLGVSACSWPLLATRPTVGAAVGAVAPEADLSPRGSRSTSCRARTVMEFRFHS